eukprot:TRINITY_DN8385_c0_g1_i1.p1 TRINITY_DN8385_c0_g1~~TRINITY_DN8385_c0_g1_i1.p1  ORF type:complete len:442 (-),score=90.28 TRINITY_DN8385_c0_g1_i1:196-1521(-)
MRLDESRIKKLGVIIVISLFSLLYFLRDSNKYSTFNDPSEDGKYNGKELGIDAKPQTWREKFMSDITIPAPSYSDIYPNNPNPSFPELSKLCNSTKWRKRAWLECGPYQLGLFNAKNRIQNCITMAVEAGLHLLIRGTNSRFNDSNLANPNGEINPYSSLFDEEWLKLVLSVNCPQMNVTFRSKWGRLTEIVQLEAIPEMRPRWDQIGNEPGLFSKAVSIALDKRNSSRSRNVILVLEFDCIFYLRVHSQIFGLQYAWGSMIRYRRDLVKIADQIAESFNSSYGAIHWRFEGDFFGFEKEMIENYNMTFENNVRWSLEFFNGTLDPHSIIYIACGDENTTKILSNLMRIEGYLPTTKFLWAEKIPGMRDTFSNLSWDAIAIIDYLVLIRSTAFVGVEMSTFSFSVTRLREVHHFKSLGFNNPKNTLLLGRNPPRRNQTFWW